MEECKCGRRTESPYRVNKTILCRECYEDHERRRSMDRQEAFNGHEFVAIIGCKDAYRRRSRSQDRYT